VPVDRLCAGLAAAGLDPLVPGGTSFGTPMSAATRAVLCRAAERCSLVAGPIGAFYDDATAARTVMRFAFCKREEVNDDAARRLAGLGAA
jgi:N-succinyldiaminopimelate aminotransferase